MQKVKLATVIKTPLAGVEPAAFGFGIQRAFHCAIGACSKRQLIRLLVFALRTTNQNFEIHGSNPTQISFLDLQEREESIQKYRYFEVRDELPLPR